VGGTAFRYCTEIEGKSGEPSPLRLKERRADIRFLALPRVAQAQDDFQRYLLAAERLYESGENERALVQLQRARMLARGLAPTRDGNTYTAQWPVPNQGLIYFGTNSTLRTGKTFGVDPAGAKQWTFDSGDVTGSPAVGALNGNEEYVYVAARGGSNSWRYALRSNETEWARCTYAGCVDIPSAISVGMVGGGGVTGEAETAVTLYNSSPQARIVRVRPDAAGLECLDTGASSIPRGIAGAVVLKDQNVFYGTSESKPTRSARELGP
jgi:hypothetical protein